RLVGAQPDLDGVSGCGAAFGARHPVVLAVDAQRAAFVGGPDPADDLDGLGERPDALSGGEALPAHGLDAVPEGARAQAQFDPAAAEQVEAGRAARQDGGLAQRQVEHVAGQADPFGAGGQVGQQGPGVQERGLVGVVLEGGQVQSGLLGELGECDHPLGILVARGEEGAETQFVAVVGQGWPPDRFPGRGVRPRTSLMLTSQLYSIWMMHQPVCGDGSVRRYRRRGDAWPTGTAPPWTGPPPPGRAGAGNAAGRYWPPWPRAACWARWPATPSSPRRRSAPTRWTG